MTAEAAPRRHLGKVDRRHLAALRPVPDTDGPLVRLGLVWAAVVLIAVTIGAVPVAVVVALVAGVAGAQTCRTWPAPGRPLAAAAGSLGLLLPLLALAGPVALVAAGGLLCGAAWVLARAAGAHPGRTVALGVAVGAAASSLVLARGMGFTEAMVLFACVAVYDASAYVVGAGAGNAWEGPAAGVASIGAVSLAVAAVYSGVFVGASPWLLALVVAVLAPAGTYLASALCGPVPARVPALRRLDSLLIAGPAWVAAASVLIGR